MTDTGLHQLHDALEQVEHLLRTPLPLSTRTHFEAQLLDLVLNDALTGLRNRRSFDQALRSEWRRAARTGEALAVLLLDVDGWTELDGALADRYLAAVGRGLAGARVRAEDTMARYAGGRFAVLLAGCGSTGAVEVGERFRQALRVLHPGAAGVGPITVHAGSSSVVPSWGGRPEQLVAAAEQALREAAEGKGGPGGLHPDGSATRVPGTARRAALGSSQPAKRRRNAGRSDPAMPVATLAAVPMPAAGTVEREGVAGTGWTVSSGT